MSFLVNRSYAPLFAKLLCSNNRRYREHYVVLFVISFCNLYAFVGTSNQFKQTIGQMLVDQKRHQMKVVWAWCPIWSMSS